MRRRRLAGRLDRAGFSPRSGRQTQFPPFAIEHDMASLASLGEPYGDGARLSVIVAGPHARQFAVTASGQKRAVHKVAEILIAGVDESLPLGGGQKTHDGRIDFPERFRVRG